MRADAVEHAAEHRAQRAIGLVDQLDAAAAEIGHVEARGCRAREEILDDFPYLTAEDIQACLAFAAERERQMLVVGS